MSCKNTNTTAENAESGEKKYDIKNSALSTNSAVNVLISEKLY
jgi:hypothetical protein